MSRYVVKGLFVHFYNLALILSLLNIFTLYTIDKKNPQNVLKFVVYVSVVSDYIHIS